MKELPKTLDDVRRLVEEIRQTGTAKCDDEAAHEEEDDLREAVLILIANGDCPDPRAFALEALKTSKFKFNRWCA